MAFWGTYLKRILAVLYLAISFVIITSVLIAIVIVTRWSYRKPSGTQDLPKTINSSAKVTSLPQTCFTTECLLASSKIIKNIDASVDPCDDFFQYACGGFEKATILPDDAAFVTFLELSEHRMELELNDLLDQPINSKDPRYVQLMKKYYNACTDKHVVEKESIKTLKSVLEKLGGWPVLEGNNWDGTNFDWITATYKAKDLGLPFQQFISLGTTSFDDGEKTILIGSPMQIRQLSKAYDEPSKAQELYGNILQTMVNVAVALGADAVSAEIEMRDSLQLEIDMYKLIVNTSSHIEYPTSLNELKLSLPTFPVDQYINHMLAPDFEMSLEDTLFYNNLPYLLKLDDFLNNTSKRAQANYFVWMIVLSNEKYLNEKVHLSLMKYGSRYGDRKESRYRWGECVADIITNFNEGCTALYAKKWMNYGTRENIRKLLDNIRSALTNTTHEVEWIDNDLRSNVVKGLLTAKVVVGFPDELLSDDTVDEFYSDLIFNEENYLQLHLNLTRFQTRSNFKMLDYEHRTNFTWVEDVPLPNSNFRGSSEFLTINIEALRPGDLFDSKQPNYLNFGGMGYWIVNGLTHLTDRHMLDEYKDRYKCFINQFGKVIRPSYSLVNNHISEQCALNEVYLAYKTLADYNEPEKLLPGLEDYTPEQLFWISIASSECAKTRQEYEENYNLLNNRIINKERINFAVKNSKYFGEIFKCPVGSMMNPLEKCTMY